MTVEAAAPGTESAAPLGRARLALAEILAAERDRWALWLPVAFGAGIGLYFAPGSEPSAWCGVSLALLGAVVAVLGRRGAVLLPAGIMVAAVGLGLAVVQLRASLAAAPVIPPGSGALIVTGRVVSVEIRPTGKRVTFDRLTLSSTALGELPRERTPERVRVTLRRAPDNLAPGDIATVRALLLPPPAPAAPGAYDFQRQAWFDRLGGVGFALGETRIVEPHTTSGCTLWLNGLRQSVIERTLAVLPGGAGAVAAALLTGEQGAIPADVMNAMRDSGLAHILSISGLHISLVAGIVFFIVRFGFALIPFVALRYPIKKWAALAALVAITLYTLFATPGAPTTRSWLMTGIVLIAILIDRTAISMRLVAWAAFAVLALQPESLLGPSFQMSFAAVVALIAAWEAGRQRFTAWRAGGGWVRRALIMLGAAGATTLVAGFATAPYALYHFNRFTLYGLAANLLAGPLTSLWVMPWAVLAFLLFPFGLEHLALVPMGWGVDGVIAVGRMVAGWDGAVALFPAMPAWGLLAVTLGGVWLCLWRTRWRLVGVPVILLGLASIGTISGPDVLVADDARLIAVRDADGLLEVSKARASKLTRETWLRRAGQQDAAAWPREGTGADGRLVCDKGACRYTLNDQVVTFVREIPAITTNCRKQEAILVATIALRYPCPGAAMVIDRAALAREGGHAIWLTVAGVRVETVRAARGDRPWTKIGEPLRPPRNATVRN